MKAGFLIQSGGAWAGIHYSKYNHRFCINLVPFFTFWITLKGGKTPHCK